MNEKTKQVLLARANKELSDEDLIVAKQELDASIEAMVVAQESKGLNELMNLPYDAEVPMTELVNEVCESKSVSQGVTVQYYAQSATTKTVYTIVNGLVTQVNVTAGSPSVLSFGFYSSPEDFMYVPDILESKYEALVNKAEDQMEAMNRKENKDVLSLIIASAESEGNTFANASGQSVITYPKLVEMVRSMAKYGSKLVLISGSTVTTDLMLMDYAEDKNRPVGVETAGISKWIKVENYQYTHSTTQTVLAVDKAVLVATNDSKKNRPVLFVRRRTNQITGTTQKERVIVTKGPGMMQGALPVLAYSVLLFGSYGLVVTNPACCAVYKKAETYS